MGTTADKLLAISNSKVAIRDAIVAKGVAVPVGTVLNDYATKIGEITTGGGGSEVADTWVRPTEWLSLPDNVDGVQKVSILNAVFNTDSEFVAFTCIGTSNGFTVDWGDGAVENYGYSAPGVKAEHKYDYSNVDLNSDTVATFGYKQCIITITPQSGTAITKVDLNQYHTTIGSGASYDLTTGFLDMRINLPSATVLIISAITDYVKHTMLEQCLIGELATTTLNYLFNNCHALQSVTIKDTSNVTSFASMHYNNYALQKMPTYTFRSAGVTIDSMFFNCYSLRETYPLVITPSASGALNNLFSGCKSLTYIDLTIISSINYTLSSICNGCLSLEDIIITQTGTGKVTSMGTAFAYTRIKESPVIDTSLCTGFSTTFQYCDRLTKLYEYNYSSATTLANMLDGCYSLKSVPNFNITASCTSLVSLCNNCWALEKAPTFSNSSGVTSIATMLGNCKSLTNIPSYTFGNVTGGNTASFLSGCDSLQIMPSITVGSSYTANANILSNCFSLKRMLMPLRFTFSVANAKMSAEALTEMYSILPTVATTQTVTVTGNYGATNTPAISLTCTLVSNSQIATMDNTSGLSVGMFATGTNITTSGSGAGGFITTSTNVIDRANPHGLIIGDIVSFNTVASSGLPLNVIMYVVDVPTTSTFKVSLTLGGAPVVLTGDGGVVYYNTPAFITSIVPNTSVTLSIPATGAGSYTLAFRSNEHKTYIATMKKWTVTG